MDNFILAGVIFAFSILFLLGIFTTTKKIRIRLILTVSFFLVSLFCYFISSLSEYSEFEMKYFDAGDAGRIIGSFLGVYLFAGILLHVSFIVNCVLGILKIAKINKIIEKKKEKYYAIALAELEKNELDKAVWAKAIANTSCNEAMAKSEYIKMRVEKLLQKFQKNK